MQIIIHRGTHQIGGSCVEVATDRARILLDIGLPLEDGTVSRRQKQANKELAEAEAAQWCEGVDAVFISHYHGDHIGLIGAVDPKTPVYMHPQAIRAHVYPQVIFSKFMERSLQPLFRTVRVGDLTVRPFRVDHSAYGAQAFLISDGRATLFYSGDMRTHGLSGDLMEKLPSGVDYAVLEGTNIDRTYYSALWTEEDVRDRFIENFRDNPSAIHYVWVSALNIDRLKMLYEACAAVGRILLVDIYTILMLRIMAKKDPSVPFGDDYPLLRTFCAGYMSYIFDRPKQGRMRQSVAKWEIDLDEVKAAPHKFVMGVRPKMEPELERVDAAEGVFVNSMWKEYENVDRFPDNRALVEYMKRYPRRHIHTSGHADRDGLMRIVRHIAPRHIIPIHTESPEQFDELFSEWDIVRLSDGQELAI